MATRKVDIGPVGECVRANLATMRDVNKLTLRELSKRMSDVGHPMAYGTIGEIERGARRVDVDDVAALAKALNCSVVDLMGLRDSPSLDALIRDRVLEAVNDAFDLGLTHAEPEDTDGDHR